MSSSMFRSVGTRATWACGEPYYEPISFRFFCPLANTFACLLTAGPWDTTFRDCVIWVPCLLISTEFRQRKEQQETNVHRRKPGSPCLPVWIAKHPAQASAPQLPQFLGSSKACPELGVHLDPQERQRHYKLKVWNNWELLGLWFLVTKRRWDGQPRKWFFVPCLVGEQLLK